MTSPETPSSRCPTCGMESGAPHAAGCSNASEVTEQYDIAAAKEELESFAEGNLELCLSSVEAALRKEVESGKPKMNFITRVVTQIGERAFSLFFVASIRDAQVALRVKRHVLEVAFDATEKILSEVFGDEPSLLGAFQRMLATERTRVVHKIFGPDTAFLDRESLENAVSFTEAERLQRMIEVASQREKELKARFDQPSGKKFLHHSLMTPPSGLLPSDRFYSIAQQGIQTQGQLQARGIKASGVGLQGEREVSVLADTRSSWVLEGFHGSGQDPLLTFVIEPTMVRERVKSAKHVGAVPGESYIENGIDPKEITGVFIEPHRAKYIQQFLALPPDEQARIRGEDMAKMLLGNNDEEDVLARGLVHAFYNHPDLSRPIYQAAQDSDVPYLAQDGARPFKEIQKRRIFPLEVVAVTDQGEKTAPLDVKPAPVADSHTSLQEHPLEHKRGLPASEYDPSPEEKEMLRECLERFRGVLPDLIWLASGWDMVRDHWVSARLWNAVKAYCFEGPLKENGTSLEHHPFIAQVAGDMAHRVSHYIFSGSIRGPNPRLVDATGKETAVPLKHSRPEGHPLNTGGGPEYRERAQSMVKEDSEVVVLSLLMARYEQRKKEGVTLKVNSRIESIFESSIMGYQEGYTYSKLRQLCETAIAHYTSERVSAGRPLPAMELVLTPEMEKAEIVTRKYLASRVVEEALKNADDSIGQMEYLLAAVRAHCAKDEGLGKDTQAIQLVSGVLEEAFRASDSPFRTSYGVDKEIRDAVVRKFVNGDFILWKGGAIKIEIEPQDSYFFVRVYDNGIGYVAKDEPKETTKRTGTGAGVPWMVESLRILANSRSPRSFYKLESDGFGAGATVTLRLELRPRKYSNETREDE